MDILADTQILVWSLDINSPLSKRQREILQDTGNRIVASHISLMELAIKKSIGKLPDFIPDINRVVEIWLENGYEILPLSEKHIFSYTSVPFLQEHRDPFDRFIIAVAKDENFAIMSEDSKFRLYSSFIQLI
jgi:PIN domain nuclease of toxin-antitoxin system